MTQKFLMFVTGGWLAGIALGQTVSFSRGLFLTGLVVAAVLCIIFRRAGPCLALACIGGWAVGSASLPPEDSILKRLASEVARCEVTGHLVERVGVFGTKAHVASAACEKGAFDGGLGDVLIDGPAGEPGSAFTGSGRFIPFGSDGFSQGRRRTGALAELALSEATFSRPEGAAGLAAEIRASARRSVSGLEPRAAALSMGLVVGDTSGFDQETEESFRRAGLSHLVAVSGSNVAIILGAVLLLGSRLPVSLRIGLAATALFMYVLVVGPEPSVLRAAAMGVVGLTAFLAGRRTEPLQALSLAALVLSALRPALVFSVGFWLSVAATLGIVLWARQLSDHVEGKIGGGRWRAALAAAFGVTCSAQFAVAPLLAIVFGELSVAGPVANLLAVPAVPAATILGFLAATAGTVVPSVGTLCSYFSEPLLAWILWVADRFGTAGWSQVTVPSHLGWSLAAVVALTAFRTSRPSTGSSLPWRAGGP